MQHRWPQPFEQQLCNDRIVGLQHARRDSP
jgi:hypothetical protein